MAEITSSTSLEQLAAIISQALEAAGILATLSGGAAVSIYTNNRLPAIMGIEQGRHTTPG